MKQSTIRELVKKSKSQREFNKKFKANPGFKYIQRSHQDIALEIRASYIRLGIKITPEFSEANIAKMSTRQPIIQYRKIIGYAKKNEVV